jgi:predicted phosphodiesterase
MSKIIIVPDVHGRTFWRLAKEKINEVDQVVFLGDYLDPYPVEGISPKKAIEELKKIIDFKKRIPREGYFVNRES